MQRLLMMILIALVAPICLGMGGLGGYPEGTVPETEARIQAEVTDRSGTKTSLNQFSMDGQTFLDAWRGQGKLTIPFQHIDSATFGEVKGNDVMVDVKLKSGTDMTLAVRSRAQFYGSTGYGAFQIKARDVFRVKFH